MSIIFQYKSFFIVLGTVKYMSKSDKFSIFLSIECLELVPNSKLKEFILVFLDILDVNEYPLSAHFRATVRFFTFICGSCGTIISIEFSDVCFVPLIFNYSFSISSKLVHDLFSLSSKHKYNIEDSSSLCIFDEDFLLLVCSNRAIFPIYLSAALEVIC